MGAKAGGQMSTLLWKEAPPTPKIEIALPVGSGIRSFQSSHGAASHAAVRVAEGELKKYVINAGEGGGRGGEGTHRFDASVARDFAQNAAVATADDENALGVRVRKERQMRDHLLVRELVALRQLNHAIEHEHTTVRLAIENHNVLVFGLLLVQDPGEGAEESGLDARCVRGAALHGRRTS